MRPLTEVLTVVRAGMLWSELNSRRRYIENQNIWNLTYESGYDLIWAKNWKRNFTGSGKEKIEN